MPCSPVAWRNISAIGCPVTLLNMVVKSPSVNMMGSKYTRPKRPLALSAPHWGQMIDKTHLKAIPVTLTSAGSLVDSILPADSHCARQRHFGVLDFFRQRCKHAGRTEAVCALRETDDERL